MGAQAAETVRVLTRVTAGSICAGVERTAGRTFRGGRAWRALFASRNGDHRLVAKPCQALLRHDARSGRPPAIQGGTALAAKDDIAGDELGLIAVRNTGMRVAILGSIANFGAITAAACTVGLMVQVRSITFRLATTAQIFAYGVLVLFGLGHYCRGVRWLSERAGAPMCECPPQSERACKRCWASRR